MTTIDKITSTKNFQTRLLYLSRLNVCAHWIFTMGYYCTPQHKEAWFKLFN